MTNSFLDRMNCHITAQGGLEQTVSSLQSRNSELEDECTTHRRTIRELEKRLDQSEEKMAESIAELQDQKDATKRQKRRVAELRREVAKKIEDMNMKMAKQFSVLDFKAEEDAKTLDTLRKQLQSAEEQLRERRLVDEKVKTEKVKTEKVKKENANKNRNENEKPDTAKPDDARRTSRGRSKSVAAQSHRDNLGSTRFVAALVIPSWEQLTNTASNKFQVASPGPQWNNNRTQSESTVKR